MKLKGFINLIFCGLIVFSCTNKPATSYTIKGNIQGIADGTKVELTPGATHKEEKPVAEAIVTNGKFSFTGVCDEPSLFFIRIANSYGLIKVMVENADITISGSTEKSEGDHGVTYNMKNVVVSGSSSHDLYLQKIAPRNMLDSLYKAYHENNKEISEALSQARMNKNAELVKKLSESDAAKKLASDEKNFFDTVEKTMNGIILDNKNSWWGPFLMLDNMSYFTPEQQPMFNQFSEEAKESRYGKILKNELFPKNFVGQALPVFTLLDNDNKETSIEALSSEKKYILVDFWASWCGPCRKEIPNLKNLYSKYSSKGFEIISISIDKKSADWEKALKDEKLPWPNFLDTRGASDSCKVKAIPTMFLLDEKGIVIADKIRGQELDQKLLELFGK